ncbi:MAG: hypothetical protein WDM81_19155 [Rhizomicrobium sp.]
MKFTPYNFAQQDVSGERKSASACSALLSARRESSPNSALRRRDAKAQIKGIDTIGKLDPVGICAVTGPVLDIEYRAAKSCI